MIILQQRLIVIDYRKSNIVYHMERLRPSRVANEVYHPSQDVVPACTLTYEKCCRLIERKTALTM